MQLVHTLKTQAVRTALVHSRPTQQRRTSRLAVASDICAQMPWRGSERGHHHFQFEEYYY